MKKSVLRFPTIKIIAGSLTLQVAPLSVPAITLLLVGGLTCQVMAGTAPAPTPSTQVGDTVRDATTNADVTVVALITDSNGDVSHVVTSDNKMLMTKTTVGAIHYISDGATPPVITQNEVISVGTNATSGLVDTVNIRPVGAAAGDPTTAVIVSTTASQTIIDEGSGAGGGAAVNPAVGTSGVINEVHRGAGGSGGNNGYGIRICVPLIGCATIGYSGTSGGNGSVGPTVNRTILQSHGLITSPSTTTITVASVGGNGGNGGNSYGSLPGLSGGDGGAGGNITVNNQTAVNVNGSNHYGLLVYSRSGDAGSAGSNYGLGQSAGKGGEGRDGGTVNVTNSGSLTTRGTGGHGIYAYSSGGSGGSGGGGWSIVGVGGSGASGGDGGNVTVTNNGTINTFGAGAHGILAQSIGGSGGDGGSAGGIVAFGGGASQGGIGRNVTVDTGATSVIRTNSNYASGIVAQSIGGSGGDSGASGGIVALGGSGGSGNNAGTINVSTLAGGVITTKGVGSYGILAQSIGGGGGNSRASGGVVNVGGSGSGGGASSTVTVTNRGNILTGLGAGTDVNQGQYAHGIFAQSIGGGGGSAGGGGGIVSLGGDGGAAGNGNTVRVTNSGGIQTSGRDARGIMAQSIGGGGGAGGASGGIVSLGGDGASGGIGGAVYVNSQTGGQIFTTAEGGDGIFAQSIGGGGGAGATSGGLVSLGGGASVGGRGGLVDARNNGLITTEGNLARGMFAQSIGGGGGSGGTSGGLVSIGGSGASASNGGTVTIVNGNASAILTKGTNSIGVYAQSIGGGGGTGGSTGGLVSIGNSSGGGGNGGVVRVTTGGSITTLGQNSSGIMAQSVGGGGGNSLGSGGVVNIGGSGGSGGNGNTVTVKSSAVINTVLQGSHGIFAQSIGGGGGNAGGSGGLVNLGGDGAGGGNGAAVTITNSGGIRTQGRDSRGIFAQSIGGGGGNGGVSGGLVSLGGDASSGGNGLNVLITNNAGGDILTEGVGSDAIFAQSIGGGGGAGAGSGGLVSLGGGGSSGGSANTVTVINHANIETLNSDSRGVFAQSVAGGGGSGGASGGLVSIGGGSSRTSSANTVTITSSGDITTRQNNSIAIFAQSIGGGGGNGGSSGGAISIGGSGSGGGNGGIVRVTNTGIINTFGDFSGGVFAQSVGGGGGNGGTSGGIVTIGGSGGSGSDANLVEVTNGKVIHTRGADSTGIFAQSVGGGGGNGGASYSGGLFAGFSLGGSGSSGGNGGTARVTLNQYLDSGITTPSLVVTEGDRSTGILAQSVGGGGGNGGTAVQGTVGTGVSLSVAIGGKGGSGGIGGAVSMTGTGDVTTLGNNSAGVILQSVGGGGGNGGTTVSAAGTIGDGVAIGVAIGGSGGSGGYGGTVTSNVTSVINTTGAFSTGFVAQSIGGGGGNGGTTVAASAAVGAAGALGVSVGIGGDGGDGGDGGTVNATLAGSVFTSGAQSDGVIIQSIGGGGGNGGTTIAASAAGGGIGAGTVTVGVGSEGGVGGVAGSATADIDSDVETRGDGSDGVIVQSIGGGGGNSGLTVSAGVSGGGMGAGGVSVGIGGDAGNGSRGDVVDANYNGTLITRGNNAVGILAQSVGGGGGNSGGTIAASLNFAGVGAGSVTAAIGGSGGTGGHGGVTGTGNSVKLVTAGSVSTAGNNSGGIVVQSVGGGGGNGGYTISGAGAGAGVGAGAVSVGLGGTGGSGGDGRNVRAVLDSVVQTSGDDSSGILVQSVGGGGGNGGFNISGAVSGAGVGSGGVTVGLGGDGGIGGVGGNVYASSAGAVTTGTLVSGVNGGHRSSGFVVQSIGGGGGNGGFNISGSLSGAGVGSGAISVGLGGNAGSGSNAGIVTGLTSGDIITAGDQSFGIIAQSVGGGGGNGGFNVSGAGSGAGVGSGAISVGLGGSGGSAGNASTVNLTVRNNVTTYGKQAGGIVAQSIGGGGGNGAFNVSGNISGAGVGSGVVGVGLGGSGSSGGNGGIVIASVIGNVVTNDDESSGLLVQSVGGGGGNGGLNVTAGANGSGVGGGGVSVGLGGSAGLGGFAESATLNMTGDIYTNGAQSRGAIVQSIGGGGGNGGMNINMAVSGSGVGDGAVAVGIGGSGGDGGISGAVVAGITGDITTLKDFSEGLIAQSIGGGGGNAALNINGAASGAGVGSGAVSVAVGGTGGTGGDSNLVTANYSGTMLTLGNYSTGMLVQAVGGGGGNGGGVIAAGGAGAGVGTGAVSVGVGGNGGAAGIGGLATQDLAVTATAAGSIQTEGNYSGAFVAQSIGGGGGNGGYSVSANITGAGTGAGSVGVGLGGDGSGGGAGKGVLTNVSATILTLGDYSDGVLSQSVGGGGGNGGFNVAAVGSGAGVGAGGVSVGLGGAGAVGGNAGAVDATATGTIQTQGNNAMGFIAQSVGGGGGNGGFNVAASGAGAGTGAGTVGVGLGGNGDVGGNGAAVIAETGGDINTFGNNSGGVLAQSIGGGGGNGGFNVSVSGSGAGTGSGAAAVGLGGTGAGGGNGSTVDFIGNNNVYTRGNKSAGIVVQSIGGGGGNGGFDVTVSGSGAGTGSGAVGVGLGGNSDGGGDGMAVTSTIIGNVATGVGVIGNDSSGVVIQSVGGGGGNGGFNVTAAISGAGTGSGSAGVGLGGTGGGGGSGSTVVSSFAGNINTNGLNSTGLIAQSLGGGGGNGGMTVAAAISVAKTGSGAASVGIGGSGGSGGSADTVNNTLVGNVVTTLDKSGGVLAQSLGGGGGNGGLSVSGTVSLASTGSGAVSVGIGGSGGSGGLAKKVTNRVTGDVYTTGADSVGIAAQSIGGGGGNGGINITGSIVAAKTGAGAIGVGVGGFGGSGGVAGDVDNTVSGYVQTLGENSVGSIAQSIGGGGGNGALNVTGLITASKSNSGSLGVGVGGFGGGGGNAGNVVNSFTGGAYTEGENADGIVAQSLGGGGGNGGVNVTGSLNLSKENGGTLGVGIGGFGGGAGNAGDVTSVVNTTATHTQVTTKGENASAVIAQSLGGGGGNGGINVTGAINLSSKNSGAIGVGIGGFGGSGGDSGVVSLSMKGNVATVGSYSHGVVAQSLAGGGGNGALNVTGSVAFSSEKTAGAASIGIGGFGGSGGDAKDVSLDYEGFINSPWVDGVPDSTAKGSHGILAQSLGGGGGNGGVNISAGVAYSNGSDSSGNALVVGFGGFGGAGGNAGNVDVVVAGGNSITAHGDLASAVFAQSLGGGGGNGGINISGGFTSSSPVIFGLGGFGGGAGTAGNVSVVSNSDLYANGTEVQNSDTNWGEDFINDIGVGLSLVDDVDPDRVGRSTGITAQSIGGGGGNGGLNISGGGSFNSKDTASSLVFGVGGFGGAGAISGEVSVVSTGYIQTVGDWSHGIMAQSLAGGGGNGGLNITSAFNWTSKPDKSSQDVSLVGGIGGFGGLGADAAKVEVTSFGDIVTKGAHSRGILAQSIGGGGGTGGMNVTTNVSKGSSPLTLGIGGFGSGGGNAGAVTVTRGSRTASAGAIVTDGTGAHGLEASSIGGGGGDAGANFSFTYSSAGAGTNDKKDDKSNRSTPKNTGVDDSVLTNYNSVLDELEGRNQSDTSTTGKKAYAAQLMIGGAGGESGDGGAVDVHHFGDVETKKNMSHGVFAQSIGGGGGNASLNMAYSKADNVDKSLDLAIGGATGDGGIGSTVVVEHSGTIITRGDDSVGVFGQSIGGGGGNAGMDMATTSNTTGNLGVTIGRKGGTGGEGGTVTMISAGLIQTFGKNSHGLLAQSVGNGGGNSSVTTIKGSTPESSGKPGKDFNLSVGLEGGVGGFAGAVDVTSSGSIVTAGESAHAIFAQSVGGGGGNGGAASLGSKLPMAVETKSYGLAIGGKGGTGGYGGTVTVANTAVLSTTGENAVGILAQSVGGGGGTGGNSMNTGRLSNNGNVFVNIGGSGGTGATGGDIDVTNGGLIVTNGLRAHGVLAQTIGGGGGQAGMTISKLYNSGTDSSTNLSVLVGGGGGDSNSTSGTVLLNNTGGVETFEAGAVGLFAQSVGGGGGNARLVTSTNVASGVGKDKNNDFSLAIGGAGGLGGTGGAVTVNNTNDGSLFSGLVATHGHGSHAIVAMSIGGGGGEGSAVSTISRSKMNGATRSLSVGGSGGTGGSSDFVTVNNSGDLYTYGDQAHGILAQSIGGGGGNAGDVITVNSRPEGETAQAISVGGKGGDGNISGNVIVDNSGTITTTGKASYGILAQSIGGGGGNGSIAIANPKNAVTSLATAKAFNSLAMGGIGGTGADSGDVTVTHTGAITVSGDNSYGIYAQSVSGGGGSIGASIGNPVSSLAATTLQLAIGAFQSEGKAGKVTLNVSGDINVTGVNSHAMFQQSVNGGGGDVNVFMDLTESAAAYSEDSVDVPENLSVVEHFTNMVTDIANDLGAEKVTDAVGSAVNYVQNGNIFSSGDSSSGSTVQSVGGGGGQSHIDIALYEGQQADATLGLGGNDNTDSSGGDVTGQRSGGLTVIGSGGAGSSTQSIGGGGGISTLNFQANPVQTAQTAPLAAFAIADQPLLLQSTSAAVTAAPVGAVRSITRLGALMGSGNDGGVITSTMSGDIMTEGDRTFGIIRQSIGAGGGIQYVSGIDTLTTSIGGSLGAQGHGKSVDLTNTGDVQTKGIQAHGIVLQSIGGGGGIQLSDSDEANVQVTRNSDNTGNGGAIQLSQTGNVVTLGDRSVAVLAQSLGGGGGVVDRLFADSAGGAGTSGDITLNFDGSVVSAGKNGVAVFAQSRGAGGRGDIALTLAVDEMISAGAGGIGVHFSGGLNNSLVSRGSMFTDDGLVGSVIKGEEGNDVVENYKLFYGQFDLGGGVNAFTNYADGSFVPGPKLDLGLATNLLRNDGFMSIGDVDLAQRTDLTGSFTQSANAKSYTELDFDSGNQTVDGGVIDRMYLTGAASLAGEMEISLLNPHLIPSGSFSKLIYNADLGVTDAGMFLNTRPSVVINYELNYPTATSSVLDYTVDFSPDNEGPMSPNLIEVGDYFNRIQGAGSTPELADTVVQLLYEPDMDSYKYRLSQMGPDFYGELQADMIHRSERFGHLLVDGGDYRIIDHDRFLWANYETERGKHKSYGDYKEVNHSSEKFALGVQQQFKNNWVAGIGFSMEDHQSDGYEGRWKSKGDSRQLGAIVKHYEGNTEYAATFSYGWGQSDVERMGQVTEAFQTDAERELESFSGMLRVAQTLTDGNGYIRPLAGLGFTRLMADDAVETGAGPLSLILHDYNETHVWTRLGMEVGQLFILESGVRIKLYGDLGFQYYLSGGETTAEASLQGAPAGVAPMKVDIDLNETHGFGSIGVEIITAEEFSFGVEYGTILDGHSTLDRWDFRARFPF